MMKYPSNIKIDHRYLKELTEVSYELYEDKCIVEQQMIDARRCNISEADMEAIKLIWGMADVRATDLLAIRKLNS